MSDRPVRLELPHPGGATAIAIGPGALAAAAAELAAEIAGRTVFAVTTPRVRELHGAALEALAAAAGRLEVLEVDEGEAAKRLAVAESLWRRMLAAGGKRDSVVVGFGGGSVGDLAGFAAAGFLRGVASVLLPTTLVAQLDAAIGGKTGVNLPEGKNTVGFFHHPRLVVADCEWLATLPAGELGSGLVEAIKMGVIADRELFERIERDLDDLVAGRPAALAPVVAAAAAAKVEIVRGDPTEGGARQALNLGHTLGHALEAASGYQGLRHGEAVAYGLLFAFRLVERRGLERTAGERVRRLLGRLELPPLPHASPAELEALLARDKKARETGLVWVLPRGLGAGVERRPLAGEEVAAALDGFLERPWD